jgi:hypothetical protein
VLNLVGNTATPFLRCISILYVAMKFAMATILGLVAFEWLYHNVLFGLQIYLCVVAIG